MHVVHWANWGPRVCFTEDALIPLLKGESIRIKDLVGIPEFYVYSFDLGSDAIVCGRAHSCHLVGIKKIVEVEFDNGNTVRCTADERFLTKNGYYVEVKDLKSGQSLKPLYRRLSDEGWRHNYEQVLQESGEWSFTHVLSDEYNLFNGVYEDIEGAVRHHKNFNKHNNSPDNIERLEFYAHRKLHAEHNRARFKTDPEYRQKMLKNLKHHGRVSDEHYDIWLENLQRAKDRIWDPNSPEYNNLESREIRNAHIKRCSERMRRYNLKNWKDPEYAERKSNEASIRLLRKWQDPEYIEYMKNYQSQNMRSLNSDPEFQKNRVAAVNSPKVKERIGKSVRKYYAENSEIIKALRMDAGAKRYGFKNNDEAVKSILEMNKLLSMRGIADRLGCSYGFVHRRVSEANHKVLCIRDAGEAKVYDFEVDIYHNFAIDVDNGKSQSSGVFVHNSGMYESVKDQIKYERKAGIESDFGNAYLENPPEDQVDDWLRPITWDEAKKANVWVLHSKFPDGMKEYAKNKIRVAVIHGPTEHMCLKQWAKQGGDINLHISLLWEMDASVFINQHEYDIMKLYDEKGGRCHYIPNSIDLERTKGVHPWQYEHHPAIISCDTPRIEKLPLHIIWAMPYLRELIPEARLNMYSLLLEPIQYWRNIFCRSHERYLESCCESVQLANRDLLPFQAGGDIGFKQQLLGDMQQGKYGDDVFWRAPWFLTMETIQSIMRRSLISIPSPSRLHNAGRI